MIKRKNQEQIMREHAYNELAKLALECSAKAKRLLHPLNDDLGPYFSTNEEIEAYHKLLDIHTLSRKLNKEI